MVGAAVLRSPLWSATAAVRTATRRWWHARLVAAGLSVTPIEDMPWGMHEFTLTDPSGNHIRVGRSTRQLRRFVHGVDSHRR